MASSSSAATTLLILAMIYLSAHMTSTSLVDSSSKPKHYIVFMDSAAMPRAFSSPYHWHLATLSSLTSLAAAPKLIYSYSHVVDGFSCSLTLPEYQALKTSHGYLHSIEDVPVEFDTTHSPEFLGLTSAGCSGAWETSNHGEGVIVGVVDTGVWPESKSFSDHGMEPVPARWRGECECGMQFNASLCNNKIIGARAFARGLMARNITVEMNSPRDEIGHGTHTSSIAAGNFVEGESFFGYAPGTVKGVAPKAHVAVYKVFEGHTFASDTIAAIDRAVGDGVDVISLSLGIDDVALYEDPVALASFGSMEKNVLITTSAGNHGPSTIKPVHNAIPWVLTVAAGSIGRKLGAEVKLGDGVSVFGESIYPGSYSPAEAPIIFVGDSMTNMTNLAGKIVVCEVDENTPGNPIADLPNSKAIGGVVITRSTIADPELFFNYPVVVMMWEDGERVKSYIKANTHPTASLKFEVTKLDTKPAPTVMSFSSRGPSWSCPSVLKPDIMGPGFLILAAWPPTVQANGDLVDIYTKFNIVSGTSMACPHLAGVGALLKKARPDWSPAAIRSAIMTTADSLDRSNKPIKDWDNRRATGLAMGAGQVNPTKALDPGLVYDLKSSDYINYLCAMNFTVGQIRAITRSSSANGTCSAPSLDLNYPSFFAFFNASRSNEVHEFRRTLTNVGNENVSYRAIVTSMDGLEVGVVPDKLVFRCTGDKARFKLVIRGFSKKKMRKPFKSSGYLRWVEEGGIHIVQSPVVATNTY